jgi:CBS domain-containing protein
MVPNPLLPLMLKRSVIACCHYDHNPGFPGRFHGLAERILRIADEDAAPERQVDDSDVVSALQSDGFLNGRDHAAVGTGAIKIQRAQIDEVYIGRCPGIISAREVAVAADDSGDVSTVTVEVILTPLEFVFAVPVKSW